MKTANGKTAEQKDSRTERQPNETKGPHGDCHTTLGCVTADCDYLRLAVAVIRGIAALLDQRRHEITIGRGLLQTRHKRLVSLLRLQTAKQTTQTVDDRQLLRIGDEFLATGAGSVHVDGRD